MESFDVKPLLFEGEHLVRTVVGHDGETWFVAQDVCRVLELKNPRSSLALLDEDEKGVHSMDTPGGAQDVTIISEPGIYRLVFASRKPVAERFKRWLAHDVIPAIRRDGRYSPSREELLPPPFAEKRPFPDWPMEELRTKKGVVDMYRLLYGAMAAQWLSPQLGFPTPPLEIVEHGRQYTLTLTPNLMAAE